MDDAVISGSNPTLTIYETDTTNLNTRFDNGGGDLYIQTVNDDGSSPKTRMLIDHATGDINLGYEDTGTTAKLFWDASAESLGVGTSSPTFATGTGLQVTSGSFASVRVNHSGSTGLDVSQAGGGAGYLYLRDNADLIFGTNNTERMRIDALGNVLVGTTSTDYNSNVGFQVKPSGQVFATASSTNPALFNRRTTDGDIAVFRKDGTSVGSIGAQSGRLTVGSNSAAGVRFDGTQLVPMSGASISDNTITLGDAGFRFKDLYLSGGVYLGGTGDANKLEDYEEGTWTPTAASYDGTMTVNSASYVKVGKLVTVKAKVSFDATSDGSGVSITNLPFATTGVGEANGGFVTSSTVSSAARVQAVGSSSLFLMAADDSNVTYTAMASTSLEFVFIYEAA
jgi:hypothetical protein